MMGNQAKDTLGVCMQGAAMILAIPYFYHCFMCLVSSQDS